MVCLCYLESCSEKAKTSDVNWGYGSCELLRDSSKIFKRRNSLFCLYFTIFSWVRVVHYLLIWKLFPTIRIDDFSLVYFKSIKNNIPSMKLFCSSPSKWTAEFIHSEKLKFVQLLKIVCLYQRDFKSCTFSLSVLSFELFNLRLICFHLHQIGH